MMETPGQVGEYFPGSGLPVEGFDRRTSAQSSEDEKLSIEHVKADLLAAGWHRRKRAPDPSDFRCRCRNREEQPQKRNNGQCFRDPWPAHDAFASDMLLHIDTDSLIVTETVGCIGIVQLTP